MYIAVCNTTCCGLHFRAFSTTLLRKEELHSNTWFTSAASGIQSAPDMDDVK